MAAAAPTTAPYASINQAIGNTLEVDERDDSQDSTLGDESDTGSFTTSLASSIMQYRQENGRTYHAYKDGNYALPNDESENDRLDLQHHLFALTFGGKLGIAPISKNPQNVLDIGTGTGIWALDFADDYPSAQVYGTDLSPIQPSFVPPNLSFQIDDSEEAWTFNKKFDYIHARMMVGSILDWPKLIKQSYDHLTPGGWLEFQDCVFPIHCDDGSIAPDSAIMKWSSLLLEGSVKMGRDLDAPPKYIKHVQAGGFSEVHQVLYKWPMNTWPKAEKDKELGAWALQNFLDGLQGFSLAIYTRVLGWTTQEVEVFLVDVRKDLQNRKLHGYWPIHVTYAKKADAPTSKEVEPVTTIPATAS